MITDREDVTLDIKSQHEESSTRRSFRWIHHQRETAPVSFTDFQRRVGQTQDLFEEELAVATRCLEHVRRHRKISARGRYFEHTVYRAETDHKVGEQQTPIRATFISIPLFALLKATDSGTGNYPSSGEIRASDLLHPLRTLLQYSNHLAIDDERDHQQVITKLDRNAGRKKAFIQVPELWSLVINMYTVVTCCPLSVNELCGKNISLRSPELSARGPVNARVGDSRTFVKYTDRRGMLVDFECRQWQTLLEYISSIEIVGDEARRIDLVNMLGREDSEIKIVDLQFQPVDRSRWIDIVDSQYERAEFVHLRLARSGDGDVLSLKFAQRQHQTFSNRTLVLTMSRLHLEVLTKRHIEAYKAGMPKEQVERLKIRLFKLRRRIRSLHRSRLLSRFMLYAARYHLMISDQTSPHEQSASLDESSGSRPHKLRRTSTTRHSLSSLFHHAIDKNRPNSPSDSISSIDPRSSSPVNVLRSSPELPQIVVHGEADSPGPLSDRLVRSSPPDRDEFAVANAASLASRQPLQSMADSTPFHADTTIDLEANLLPGHTHSPRRSSTYVNFQNHKEGPLSQLVIPTDAATVPLKSSRRMIRRHSTSTSGSSITLLDPSPLRQPLHGESDAALRVPPRSSNGRPRPEPRRQGTSITIPPSIEHTPRPPLGLDSVDIDESDFSQSLAFRANSRISGALERLHPFFKVQREEAMGRDCRRTERLASNKAANSPSKDKDLPEDGVLSILDLVDEMLRKDDTFKSRGLDDKLLEYASVSGSSFAAVCRRLNAEREALENARKTDKHLAEYEANSTLHEHKCELFLSTYGILR